MLACNLMHCNICTTQLCLDYTVNEMAQGFWTLFSFSFAKVTHVSCRQCIDAANGYMSWQPLTKKAPVVLFPGGFQVRVPGYGKLHNLRQQQGHDLPEEEMILLKKKEICNHHYWCLFDSMLLQRVIRGMQGETNDEMRAEAPWIWVCMNYSNLTDLDCMSFKWSGTIAITTKPRWVLINWSSVLSLFG